MADEIEQRRAAKTTEMMRRGGVRGNSYDIRGQDEFGVGIVCDGCGEVIDAGENMRTASIGGVLDVRFHNVCYGAWLNFTE
jgi:hypothetical protein